MIAHDINCIYVMGDYTACQKVYANAQAFFSVELWSWVGSDRALARGH